MTQIPLVIRALWYCRQQWLSYISSFHHSSLIYKWWPSYNRTGFKHNH